MKIGSFQGISNAYFIRNDVQELAAVKKIQALNTYKASQASKLDDSNPNVNEYGGAIVEISDRARELAASDAACGVPKLK